MTGAQLPNERLETLIRDYCAAWSEPDADRRLEILHQVWSPDGIYTDPNGHVEGRPHLSAHIGKVLAESLPAGARIVPASHADAHHDEFRFAWKSVLPDGSVSLEGVDFGELDSHGHIRHIVGFFGALQPIGASPPGATDAA